MSIQNQKCVRPPPPASQVTSFPSPSPDPPIPMPHDDYWLSQNSNSNSGEISGGGFDMPRDGSGKPETDARTRAHCKMETCGAGVEGGEATSAIHPALPPIDVDDDDDSFTFDDDDCKEREDSFPPWPLHPGDGLDPWLASSQKRPWPLSRMQRNVPQRRASWRVDQWREASTRSAECSSSERELTSCWRTWLEKE